ncbi:MAG: hypothetical protein ABEJ07_05600 [Candidatus Nanohaloarchaea archaeon]
MVMFTESDIPAKADHMFVHEDPARLYRGLREMLVEEFDMDRVEEGRMEFNVSKPKDRVRLHAYKEKSPHTVIYYSISMKAKPPRDVYKHDRPDDIMKARVKVTPLVFTMYPGGEPISWEPRPQSEWPTERVGGDRPGLMAEPEDVTRFQRSKLYRILVGIWYNKFYSKEIERYKEEAEESMLRMMNLFREKFGVEEAVGRTGASHYRPPWK